MNKKNLLDSYKGLLSVAEIAAGMNIAIQNASRLLGDAKILFEAENLL